MRVLLLCNKSPWPPKDGGAQATLGLIRCLSTANINVTVLSLNSIKHRVRSEDIPADIKKQADIRLIDINESIKPFELFLNLFFSSKPYNLERYNSERFRSELKKMNLDEYDIIQIEGLAMHHYLNLIRSLTSKPVVFRPHNVENIIWQGLALEEKNILRKIYFKMLSGRLKKTEIRVLNDFDALMPVSKKDNDWFINAGIIKPGLVFTQAVAVSENPPAIKNLINKVCFIGALDWRPNVNGIMWFLNNVWPLVLNKMADAELHIAGRNASRNTKNKLTGVNVFFAGEVDNSVQFMADKAVIVVPLFSGSGARMKIIEGMSLGKSIVATPLAAEGIDYEDGKDLFICDDPESFSATIVKLLNDTELRMTTMKNALGNVRKKYNIFESADRIQIFYRELIA
jgi:polysaccharide biosynthesis protein PslH